MAEHRTEAPHPTGEEPAGHATLDIELLDGATADLASIANEVATQRRVAVDSSQDLQERLEAYEDIIDSQVGDTTLVRARNVEREFGVRQIFLKFEGGNPTGTQKDRIAFAQAMDALRRGFDAVTVATCGNYGVAMALAASLAGLRFRAFVPAAYRTRRTQEMESLGAEVIRVDGDYEAAINVSREHAERDEVYDANPGGANVALQLRAYGEIAYEIYDELRDAPRVVALPVSNGTTLAGVYKGFTSLYRRGKTSRMPRVVAGSTFKKNPIVQAFVRGAERCEDLDPQRIRETAVNEPLVNWHSVDGDYALEAIRSTGGWATNASDTNMMAFSKLIREREGLHVLPASTAGLIGLLDPSHRDDLRNDRYVVVLTGRRS
jgi:threonine synthase